MAKPLTKTTKSGIGYARSAEVERQIDELLALESEDRLRRCLVTIVANPGYVMSETLVHLARASLKDGSKAEIAALYPALERRVARRFRHPEAYAGPVQIASLQLRETVLDALRLMLARDIHGPVSALDFFEVRFDRALSMLRLDAMKPIRREAKRWAPLYSAGGIAPTAEAEQASASAAETEPSLEERWSHFTSLASSLPPLERSIVDLLGQGLAIASNDPETPTVSKLLGRSDRTIRARRDLAFASLRRRHAAAHCSSSECARSAPCRKRGCCWSR